ncbi:N-acetylglucosamine kinase [Microbacterium sp. bgisy189]|uniref:N-acetylglucosamine kinase n=1 Tax=Microbacterium sp. bgisy189 TaxID=3413798 RepID=UPI003EC10FA3
MTASLAVDAGQTGTKIRLTRTGGAPVELTYPGVRTHEPLMPQLASVAHALHGDIDQRFDVISVGVSGLTSADADAATLLRLTAGLGARRVLLTHDSVTSFLGSLGDARGAVVAAGTGVVTLAVGARRVARIDGWGNIMGDAGSAYWIGREALDAAMRAYDGRISPTALTGVVKEQWPDIEQAYIALQSDPERVRIVASFAAAVTELAATDAAAAQISLRAARELALSVSTGLSRVTDPEDSREGRVVGMVGGVFRSPVIRSRFEELMGESWPEVEIRVPQGTGLDGAATLPELEDAHPLHAQIAVADAH